MLIREDGRTRLATLDELEQRYSQAAIDDVMSMPGRWHGSGVDRPDDHQPVLAIFNCVLESDMLARRMRSETTER